MALFTLAEVAERSGWPESVLKDRGRHPEEFEDVASFLEFVCYGDHSRAQIGVLHDGVRKLGLQDSLPSSLLSSCAQQSSAIDAVLGAIEDNDEMDGDLFWWFPDQCHREEVSGRSMRSRLQKFRQNGSDAFLTYIAELRSEHRVAHKLTGELSMTLTTKDVKDCVCGRLPMWDRGHGFIGAEGAGSCLHVDQAWWSNVSKNFLGYKLVALWGPEAATTALAKCGGELYRKPLSCEQRETLFAASRIALLQPGDVASFTGGLPHVTSVIGDGLNLMFYESFVNWSQSNLDLLLRGAARPPDDRWWQEVMGHENLEGLLSDIIDAVKECAATRCFPPSARSTLTCSEDWLSDLRAFIATKNPSRRKRCRQSSFSPSPSQSDDCCSNGPELEEG
eukprot:gnl/TRDRNA2_/TRDRNA2_201933_c0_seq1.p1 gnl/TRDRNA2_/TRDRNA2_201933_c0~~gnl/TRDRNA2_/TRDRNA2_201933_c0_seq1.p1  ORF type:complete len:392 (+),score=56.84 gnl/TRDRNA2_/TRDRNA2_201933_c0_seq1:139-1314(+)